MMTEVWKQKDENSVIIDFQVFVFVFSHFHLCSFVFCICTFGFFLHVVITEENVMALLEHRTQYWLLREYFYKLTVFYTLKLKQILYQLNWFLCFFNKLHTDYWYIIKKIEIKWYFIIHYFVIFQFVKYSFIHLNNFVHVITLTYTLL